MKERTGMALLLGPPKDEEGDDDESEDPSRGEMAVKAFFKAGNKGEWDKALKALEEAMIYCDDMHEEDEHEDDEESDEDEM